MFVQYLHLCKEGGYFITIRCLLNKESKECRKVKNKFLCKLNLDRLAFVSLLVRRQHRLQDVCFSAGFRILPFINGTHRRQRRQGRRRNSTNLSTDFNFNSRNSIDTQLFSCLVYSIWNVSSLSYNNINHSFSITCYLLSINLSAIDPRYIAIIYPLRANSAFLRRGHFMLLAAWALSALCSIPQVSK